MYLPITTYLDDYDLSQIGFALSPPEQGIPLIRDVVERRYGTAAIAARDGLTLTDLSSVRAERTFVTAGTLVADTGAALLANFRALSYRAGGDREIRIRFVDDASREILAINRRIGFTYLGHRVPGVAARVELEWQALDPAWRDTSDTSVVLSGVAAACALGTAKSWPVITLDGAVTPVVDPVIEYRTNAGVLLTSLTLTISLGAGDTVVVDMDARTITDPSSAIDPSLRTAGSYFALDPYDDDWLTDVYPTLKLSSTSGTPTGSAVYRKRWAA